MKTPRKLLSLEDQLKIQEQVQFKLQQEQQAGQTGNSSKVPPKITKNDKVVSWNLWDRV